LYTKNWTIGSRAALRANTAVPAVVTNITTGPLTQSGTKCAGMKKGSAAIVIAQRFEHAAIVCE